MLMLPFGSLLPVTPATVVKTYFDLGSSSALTVTRTWPEAGRTSPGSDNLRRCVWAVGVTGLRDFLIHDAVCLLLHIEMVVTVEDGADVMFDEELMDRRSANPAQGGSLRSHPAIAVLPPHLR